MGGQVKLSIKNNISNIVSTPLGAINPGASQIFDVDPVHIDSIVSQLNAMGNRVSYNIIDSTVKQQTIGTNLYVNGDTGSDTNSGLLNSPFKTIQAAIDALPSVITSPTTINISAGTYRGFRMENISFGKTATEAGAYLSLLGTMGQYTPVSGSATGTISSLNLVNSTGLSTFTVTGAGWTVNDLKGKYVQNITKNTIRRTPIISNTADTITFYEINTGVFAVSDVISIVEPKTIISATQTYERTFNASYQSVTPSSTGQNDSTEGNVVVRICNVGNSEHSLTADVPRVLIGNMTVTTSLAGTSRIRVASSNLILRNITTLGSGSGAHIHETSSCITVVGWYSSGTGNAFQSPTVSAAVYRSKTLFLTAFIERSNTGTGFFGGGRVTLTDVYMKGCTTGISMQDGGYSLTRVGFDTMTNGIIADQVAAYSNLVNSQLGFNGGFMSNCTTAISMRGLHWAQMKFVEGTGNGTGIVVEQGARVGIRSDWNVLATTELNIDGVTSTYAAMRALTPKVLNNVSWFSMVYESTFS